MYLRESRLISLLSSCVNLINTSGHMERHTPNTSASVKTIILFSFILIKFLINYNLILPGYDLQRDEYLHLDQASHLAWGYMSVPPVTSWLSYIIQLLGNSLFWIKFFPTLFGALTMVVVWKAIEELGGNLFALILGASCVTFSVLFRLNILYQPNSLDVLCWTILYYFILKYINRQQSKWIWYAAVTFAIGFLNKYNIVFAVLGIIPALLLSPERKIFANRNLYFAMLLSLVLILPNLIWQYHNGFPVIHHMKELSKFQLIHVDRWNFIRSQFFLFPWKFYCDYSGILRITLLQSSEKIPFILLVFSFYHRTFSLFQSKRLLRHRALSHLLFIWSGLCVLFNGQKPCADIKTCMYTYCNRILYSGIHGCISKQKP